MAIADYYLCDLCGTKCFYDAELNYAYENVPEDKKVRGTDYKLDNCGDILAICINCAKTHRIVIEQI